MSSVKKEIVALTISIISFFLLAASFLFMPLENKQLQIMAGVMFWLFLILGIGSQVLLAILFKQACAKNKEWRIQKHRIGIFVIGKNKLSIAADIVLLTSALTFAVLMFLTRGTGYISYIVLTILVFSFCMHCILNGKVYYYICERAKRLKKGGKTNEE